MLRTEAPDKTQLYTTTFQKLPNCYRVGGSTQPEPIVLVTIAVIAIIFSRILVIIMIILVRIRITVETSGRDAPEVAQPGATPFATSLLGSFEALHRGRNHQNRALGCNSYIGDFKGLVFLIAGLGLIILH